VLTLVGQLLSTEREPDGSWQLAQIEAAPRGDVGHSERAMRASGSAEAS
jgi:hypothetical protein